MKIIIPDFPLPPSANTHLVPARGRLIKSSTHRDYAKQCEIWRLANLTFVREASQALNEIKVALEKHKKVFALQVDCYFVFEHKRLFTVHNKVQQLDCNNRIKPVLDGLVKVLGIDDKHYFSGASEKISAQSKHDERTVIRITPMSPRTLADLSGLF